MGRAQARPHRGAVYTKDLENSRSLMHEQPRQDITVTTLDRSRWQVAAGQRHTCGRSSWRAEAGRRV